MFGTSQSVNSQVEAIIQSIQEEAKHAITVEIPSQIILLSREISENRSEILRLDRSIDSPFEEAELNLKSKKRKLNENGNGNLDSKSPESRFEPDSALHRKQLHLLTRVETMIRISDTLKLLMTLKKDHTDEETEETTEDCITEFARASAVSHFMLSQIHRHYSTRGGMVTDILKNPLVKDYVFALDAFDRETLALTRNQLIDLRDIYLNLAHLIRELELSGS